MLNRQSLRLAATLLFGGLFIFFLAGLFHADWLDANNHAAAFADYAASGVWIAAHLGQFAGMVTVHNRVPTWLGFLSMLIWSFWLLVIAWRAKAATPVTPSAPPAYSIHHAS